jgi:hypothetical protein
MLRDLDLPPLGGDSECIGPALTRTLPIYALTARGTDDGLAPGGIRQDDGR